MTGFARVLEFEAEDRDVARDELVCGPLRAAVKHMLEHPYNFDWTVQGFGMMRAYLPGPVYDKQFRINIWDGTLAVPNVSVIHDHPWAFKSWIINGRFTNVRYIPNERLGVAYNYMTIKTGVGGGPSGPPKVMRLLESAPEAYWTGDTYQQAPTEIHRSVPMDHTVTLNERTRVGDGEHARVFWPYKEQWVDAMPREARLHDMYVVQKALECWQ
jgi:hypothetical protein